jgi:hypothetical protein
MVKASPVQSSFNAGEWSPHVWGRQEGVDSYENSCREVSNFDLLVQGPAKFRPGFRYIRREPDLSFGEKQSRLIRFEFSTVQAYAIEFCDLKIRFYRGRGVLTEATKVISGISQANPAVVTSVAHGFSNGNEVYVTGVTGMTEINNRFFKIANVTTDTFELVGLDSAGFDAWVSGGTVARIYEIASPYSEEEIWELNYTQSADVLYLVHPDHQPRQLIRSGETSWAFSLLVLRDGPYNDMNITTTTLTASATSGSVTVTASSTTGINGNAGFQTTDVGRVIRLIHTGGIGWGRITARASTTSVTVQVESNFSATSATRDWLLGAFSNTDGWPSVVTFHQDRLSFMEAPGEPQGVFMSARGNYDFFAPTEYDGEVEPQNALTFFLDSNTVNKIFWALPIGRSLVLGTANSEWTIGANTSGEALTATTAVAQEGTTFGSAAIRAIKVNNTALFIGKTERTMGKVGYSFENDSYSADSMNLLADHIMFGGVREIAYAGEPDNRVYVVMRDGRLLTVTYKPEQNVSGWASIKTNGRVLSCCVIPSFDGADNDLYLTVEREIDGVKYKFTEVQDNDFRFADSIEDAHFLDCAAKYDGRIYPDASLVISGATGEVTIIASVSSFSNAKVSDYIRIDGSIAQIDSIDSDTELTATVLSDYTFPLTAKSGEWELLIRRSSLSGLWHLEGEEVTILADGATHPARTVTNGSISLDDSYHVIHVGLGYVGRIVSRMFEAGSQTGSAQGKIKRINRAVLQLFDTLGGWVGITSYDMKRSKMTEMQFRRVDDRMDLTVGLKSGFFQEAWPSEYSREGSVVIEQRQPLPMTVISIAADMTTYDGN